MKLVKSFLSHAKSSEVNIQSCPLAESQRTNQLKEDMSWLLSGKPLDFWQKTMLGNREADNEFGEAAKDLKYTMSEHTDAKYLLWLSLSNLADIHKYVSGDATMKEIQEAVAAGDAGGDVDKIAKGETSGAITSKGPKVLGSKHKKHKKKKTDDGTLKESKIETAIQTAVLYKKLTSIDKTTKELVQSVEDKFPSESDKSAVVNAIRKAKRSGSTEELLTTILSVLGVLFGSGHGILK